MMRTPRKPITTEVVKKAIITARPMTKARMDH